MIKLSLIFLSILFFSFISNTSAQTSYQSDTFLIEAAIMDYVEAIYTADTTRIYRSVHPTLVKRGTWYDDQSRSYLPLQEMSFQQLLDLTKLWNSDGGRANEDSIREVTVFDVQDKTASAKLTAVWGTDYFHLAKLEDRWFIINVLWQSSPR